MKEEVCGKVTANGEPCTRPAGWGTDNNEGPCKSHTSEKDSKIQDAKKRFIEKLEDGLTTINGAAQAIGYDQSTVYTWRQSDEDFDLRVKEAKRKQKSMRAERAKDAIFQRVINGDAAASTQIFWLKNNTDWSNESAAVNVRQEQSQGQARRTEIVFESGESIVDNDSVREYREERRRQMQDGGRR
jgi:hypothetical protein